MGTLEDLSPFRFLKTSRWRSARHVEGDVYSIWVSESGCEWHVVVEFQLNFANLVLPIILDSLLHYVQGWHGINFPRKKSSKLTTIGRRKLHTNCIMHAVTYHKMIYF
ncbi:uncharacterized protein [Spinacia oleracea]|uniref:Uncharacterized protein isoform X1 n=1 Tax=Spinacia oleracea TaxID=3562 RepID=A0A9R0IKP4_SPIOL|nr:uncharacterized protein LOC110790672 isoform X1 [Spinacia oleracea]